jgi:hypothetical protein
MQFILLLLALPILDPSKALRHKIDYSYVAQATNVFPSTLTTIYKPSNEGRPDGSNIVDESPFNFHTRCFFLALRSYSLGVAKVIRMCRTERMYFFSRYHSEVVNGTASAEIKFEYNRRTITRMSRDIYLKNMPLMSGSVTLLSAAARWLTLEACRFDATNMSDTPLSNIKITLPIREEPSAAFSKIPEHILSDILDMVVFVGEEVPDALDNVDLSDIYVMVIVFLNALHFINVPDLRAKLGIINIMY